jgi:hypothetical protein
MPMSEDGRELVERAHREAVERHAQQQAQGDVLVKALFQEAVERHREEQAQGRALVESAHQEAVEHARGQPLPVSEPASLHYTELPAASSGSPLRQEWEIYRREAGRLLAEGHEGRHVLIKGEQIIGLWDTHAEALAAGYERFPGQPFLVHQVREREPLLRCISVHRCRNIRIR